MINMYIDFDIEIKNCYKKFCRNKKLTLGEQILIRDFSLYLIEMKNYSSAILLSYFYDNELSHTEKGIIYYYYDYLTEGDDNLWSI